MVSRDFILWRSGRAAGLRSSRWKTDTCPQRRNHCQTFAGSPMLRGQGNVFLVSHGHSHIRTIPNVETFPPHCVKGRLALNWSRGYYGQRPHAFPTNRSYECCPNTRIGINESCWDKSRLSTSSKAATLTSLAKLGTDAEFVVFGVVTEYCVSSCRQRPPRTRSPRRRGHGCDSDFKRRTKAKRPSRSLFASGQD